MVKDAKGRLDPGYRMHAFVCGHERPEGAVRGCCTAKSSIELMMELKRMAREAGLEDVRVQKSGCLDFCENGPTCVVYPQGDWFSLNENALHSILDYLSGGDAPEEYRMNLSD